MNDSWSAIWVQFKCGLRIRKTELTHYTNWQNEGRAIWLRDIKDPLMVSETLDEIDILLDKTLSKEPTNELHYCNANGSGLRVF